MGNWGRTERTKYPGIYCVTRGTSERYVVSSRLRGTGQRTKTFLRLADALQFQAETRDPEKARRMRSREYSTQDAERPQRGVQGAETT